MTVRNLLHRTKLQEFLNWCEMQGHTTGPPRGHYQVATINVKGWPFMQVIYDRENEPDHYSVSDQHARLVRQWIDSRAEPAVEQPAEYQPETEQGEPPW